MFCKRATTFPIALCTMCKSIFLDRYVYREIRRRTEWPDSITLCSWTILSSLVSLRIGQRFRDPQFFTSLRRRRKEGLPKSEGRYSHSGRLFDLVRGTGRWTVRTTDLVEKERTVMRKRFRLNESEYVKEVTHRKKVTRFCEDGYE